jgi:cytochrome c556
MRWSILSGLLVAGMVFGLLGFTGTTGSADVGQSPITDEGKKDDEKKDDEKRDDEKEKKEGEEDKNDPLSKQEYDDLMNDIQRAWNRLKILHRNRRAEQAAEQADEIAKLAPKVLRYDGEVLKGRNKGEKAREQRDFQRWAADLQRGAEEFARQARRGDWDRAAVAREQINKSCGDCHELYEPES